MEARTFQKNACPYDPTGTTDFVPPTPPKLQGVFFNWTPPKLSKYKFLYNLWHLEKFWASLHGFLYLENLGGV